MHQNDVTTIT